MSKKKKKNNNFLLLLVVFLLLLVAVYFYSVSDKDKKKPPVAPSVSPQPPAPTYDFTKYGRITFGMLRNMGIAFAVDSLGSMYRFRQKTWLDNSSPDGWRYEGKYEGQVPIQDIYVYLPGKNYTYKGFSSMEELQAFYRSDVWKN